jgi:hypothetical protein
VARRTLTILGLLLCSTCSVLAHASDTSDLSPWSEPGGQPAQTPSSTCSVLYLGVVGGLETANNRRSGIVQIRDTLRSPGYSYVCAKSVSPYVWRSGLWWVLQYFPSDPAQLTQREIEGTPKIILVGHSLGGWAVLSIARSLNRRNIPVELCIQIDSVGLTDHTVPGNVRSAAIFHARDVLWPVVTKSIKLQNSRFTKAVGNVAIKGAGHESVTRDPQIRDLVIRTVESLGAASNSRGGP